MGCSKKLYNVLGVFTVIIICNLFPKVCSKISFFSDFFYIFLTIFSLPPVIMCCYFAQFCWLLFGHLYCEIVFICLNRLCSFSFLIYYQFISVYPAHDIGYSAQPFFILWILPKTGSPNVRPMLYYIEKILDHNKNPLAARISCRCFS